MIKEAENIILNKEYFELTAEELATVSELVQNAEEFDEMKWFLASTQQALVKDKIEASPELKKRVMEHLEKPADNRKFWLNGVVVFLFPEDKKFYQKPAFQMSLAAVLVIGFLLIYDRPMDQSTMAINDSEQELDPTKLNMEETIISEDGVEESENQFLPQQDSFAVVESDIILDGGGAIDETVILEVDAEEEPMMDMVEESDDIPQDGYYQGPTEELESADEAPATVVGNSNMTTNNSSGNVSLNSVEVTTTDKSPGENEGGKDFKGNKNDGKDKRNSRLDNSSKKKVKTTVNKDRFMSKKSDAPSVNTVSTDDQDLDNSKDQMDYNTQAGFALEDANQEISKELKEKEEEKIKPYELHINSQKELKGLFTTFK